MEVSDDWLRDEMDSESDEDDRDRDKGLGDPAPMSPMDQTKWISLNQTMDLSSVLISG